MNFRFRFVLYAVNVTFHTIGAIATAAVLSSRRSAQCSPILDRLPLLTVGFVAGILAHGALDHVPHTYPIPSAFDVFLGLTLFLVAIASSKHEHRVLLGACFAGSVLPDFIDLGPAIINRRLGWSLPVVKVFPLALATILWINLRPQMACELFPGALRRSGRELGSDAPVSLFTLRFETGEAAINPVSTHNLSRDEWWFTLCTRVKAHATNCHWCRIGTLTVRLSSIFIAKSPKGVNRWEDQPPYCWCLALTKRDW